MRGFGKATRRQSGRDALPLTNDRKNRAPFPAAIPGHCLPGYLTVSVTSVECVIAPEVAVIIIVLVPRGVPLELLPLL